MGWKIGKEKWEVGSGTGKKFNRFVATQAFCLLGVNKVADRNSITIAIFSMTRICSGEL